MLGIMKLPMLLAALIALTAPAFAQATWYVDASASPGPGSGSQFDPFCTIPSALVAAACGDTVLV
ncbi:MAG: hypothetical protein ACI9OJ_001621, partial [Myxococcota bacterium]